MEKITFWQPTTNHRVVQTEWHSNLGVYDKVNTPSIKFKVFMATGKNGEKWWYGGNPFGSFMNEIFILDSSLSRDEAFEIALKEKYPIFEKQIISKTEVIYKIPGEKHQFSGGPSGVKFCDLKYKIEYIK